MAFFKMAAPDPERSHGRTRFRILDGATNKLVTYPSGRVRWFASEAAADDWIRSQQTPVRPFRLRNYSRSP